MDNSVVGWTSAFAGDRQLSFFVRGLGKGYAVIENITTPVPYLKPFPAFEDVFAEPLTLHRKHFLPLISVDASVIYSDLDFWLHFVTPIEPLLELDVGYFTEEYHDFYNIQGQYALRFVDGKYAFDGDFNWVQLAILHVNIAGFALETRFFRH